MWLRHVTISHPLPLGQSLEAKLSSASYLVSMDSEQRKQVTSRIHPSISLGGYAWWNSYLWTRVPSCPGRCYRFSVSGYFWMADSWATLSSALLQCSLPWAPFCLYGTAYCLFLWSMCVCSSYYSKHDLVISTSSGEQFSVPASILNKPTEKLCCYIYVKTTCSLVA